VPTNLASLLITLQPHQHKDMRHATSTLHLLLSNTYTFHYLNKWNKFCFLQYHSLSMYPKIVINILLQKLHVINTGIVLHLFTTYAPVPYPRCTTLASNISICIPKFNLIIKAHEINTHCFENCVTPPLLLKMPKYHANFKLACNMEL
jgi:hypothetical protein